MPPTQDPQTTFKPNLTCIFQSARTRYIISIPNGGPCKSDKKYPCLGGIGIMMIFQLTAAFLIRFVFTIFVIITNPRKWDTLSSLGLAGPFFRAAGSTNWKEKNENVVNDKVTF